MLYPPYDSLPPTELTRIVDESPDDANLRVWMEGITIEGREMSKGVLLPLGPATDAQGEPIPARGRLASAGLTVMALGEHVQVANVRFGSAAARVGAEQGFDITAIEMPAEDQPAKEWMYIPPLFLLALVWWNQRRRARRNPPASAPPSTPTSQA